MSHRPWRPVRGASGSRKKPQAFASASLESRTVAAVMISVFLGCSTPALASSDKGARIAADRFTQTYLAYPGGRMEHSEWLTRWTRTMTPNLAGLVESALLAVSHDACEGAPAFEGDLLTSVAEGATSAAITRCNIQGTRARCDVRYTLLTPRDPEPHRWTEVITLESLGGAWRVDGYFRSSRARNTDSLAHRLKGLIGTASNCPE